MSAVALEQQTKAPSFENIYGSSDYVDCFSNTEAVTAIPVVIYHMKYEWELSGNLKVDKTNEKTDSVMNISINKTSRYTLPGKWSLIVGIYDREDEQILEQEFELLDQSGEQKFPVEIDETHNITSMDSIAVTAYLELKPAYYSDEWATEINFQDDQRAHDVVITIAETKFYLHKVYLSTWSRYFDRLFFGKFKEKDSYVVKLEELDAEEFETLIYLIHPDVSTDINEENVEYLMKLADRFEIPTIMVKCGSYLENLDECPQLSILDRLEMADKYNLAHLLITCLKYIHSMPWTERGNFMDENRERIRQLSPSTLKNLI